MQQNSVSIIKLAAHNVDSERRQTIGSTTWLHFSVEEEIKEKVFHYCLARVSVPDFHS